MNCVILLNQGHHSILLPKKGGGRLRNSWLRMEHSCHLISTIADLILHFITAQDLNGPMRRWSDFDRKTCRRGRHLTVLKANLLFRDVAWYAWIYVVRINEELKYDNLLLWYMDGLLHAWGRITILSCWILLLWERWCTTVTVNVICCCAIIVICALCACNALKLTMEVLLLWTGNFVMNNCIFQNFILILSATFSVLQN